MTGNIDADFSHDQTSILDNQKDTNNRNEGLVNNDWDFSAYNNDILLVIARQSP